MFCDKTKKLVKWFITLYDFGNRLTLRLRFQKLFYYSCLSEKCVVHGQLSAQQLVHPTTDLQGHHSSDACNHWHETVSTGHPAELPTVEGKTWETCSEESGSWLPCTKLWKSQHML